MTSLKLRVIVSVTVRHPKTDDCGSEIFVYSKDIEDSEHARQTWPLFANWSLGRAIQDMAVRHPEYLYVTHAITQDWGDASEAE